MPSIQFAETRQHAKSGKVSFRGFNGEGYLNAIKTLIDGIPSNVSGGNQRFIDMLFPLEISYIEVVRGTNDPRYGLHNIGGNVNFGTRQGGNYTDARLSYGSYDTRQAQLAIGREGNYFAQNYFVGYQASSGYRAHDSSKKYSIGGKWFYGNLNDGMRIGLTARAYRIRQSLGRTERYRRWPAPRRQPRSVQMLLVGTQSRLTCSCRIVRFSRQPTPPG